MTRARLLLVSGSLRRRSTNAAALRTAAAFVAEADPNADAVLYEQLAELPAFNPDLDTSPLPTAVESMREQVRAADAMLLSVPEYAGALPGAFKNWLDWTVGDDQPRSMNGKPVGWLNVSPRGAVNAHESLRTVLGYVGAVIVEAACVEVPFTEARVGDDGLVDDDAVRAAISQAVDALVASSSGTNTR